MSAQLLDLGAQHSSLEPELSRAIERVLDHKRFISGPEVEQFEKQFATYCGAAEAVGVSSGTSAIALVLRALGIGPGDEVITTPFTFVATIEAILEVGATPVLADVDYETALPTVDSVADQVSDETTAVIAVHLYGQSVDLPAFRDLCDRRGLALIEDAAQAHGGSFSEVKVGSCGDASTFSFFPGKNLGAIGDAGAITTGNATLAADLRSLRDHGRVDKNLHTKPGYNVRMDAIHAAVLKVKLPHLDRWNAQRHENASFYDGELLEVDAINPLECREQATHVYHQYVVRCTERDSLRNFLGEREIATGVHYPLAAHQQPGFKKLFSGREFPSAERLAAEVLSLPVHPDLCKSDLELIVDNIREFSSSHLVSRSV